MTIGAYLDEFAFRFNRRGSRHLGLPFQRLRSFARTTLPATQHQLVGA